VGRDGLFRGDRPAVAGLGGGGDLRGAVMGEPGTRRRRVPTAGEAVAAARTTMVTARVPSWLETLGRGSWLVLGLVGVIAVTLVLLGVISSLMIPLAVAAVVAAIVVPLVDVLERWHVRRWLGAALVLLLGLAIVVGVTAIVVVGIVDQSDEIAAQAGAASRRAATVEPTVAGSDQVHAAVLSTIRIVFGGVLGRLFGSVVGFVVGLVMGIFILLFLLKDWATIVTWAGRHAGLPEPLGARLVQHAIEAFRAYARGLTLIGVANAVIIGVGMLAIGVPLPGTIAVVTFVGSYVPYLGAFVSGAFAVVIAYGGGGLWLALIALAIVLLAQNTLQNLLEPKAFGSQLRLHPLVVLLVVSGGALLFGVFGAILAAPLTSVAVQTTADFRTTATAIDTEP
jgi:predicted PurR-regulated permease PerM